MKFLPILLAILLIASAVAPGFAISQDSELILRVAMQDDMKGTNPITVSDVWSWNVLGYLYDGPISVNPETDELIPYIAVGSANLSGKADGWSNCAIGNFGYSPESTWANSTKQETIIFYDFENVMWHDGHQMDIRDIMFSMHLASQVPEWSSTVNPLKANGGRPGSSNYSTTSWLHVYKVWESPDKMQAALRFQLQEPFADFFRSTLSTFLLPEHIWAYKIAGQTVDGAKIWCDAGYSPGTSDSWQVAAAQEFNNYPPIGNGPFKFEFWEKGQMSKTTTWRDHFFREDYKYKDYVGTDEYGRSLARQPNIDAITYRIYKTAEAAVLALKADDIDYIAWSVPPTFVQELSNEPGVALQQSPETGFYYMAYNMRRESFGYNETGADVGKPLRQAIAHCIDKDRIVSTRIESSPDFS
jgi:ABC-type transport system substrate-binding protein